MLKKDENRIEEFINNSDIILRDYLAIERTKLANERTFFSYIRSSIYLLLAGIALIQLNEFKNIKWLGFLAFVIALLFFIIGIIRYYQRNKRLSKYYKKAKEYKFNNSN